MKRHQGGITTVEFAIIGLVVIVVLFGVLEMGRMLFVMNTLTEGTRRGARVAAVCPINDPSIARATVFSEDGSNSAIIRGLTTANVTVEYLDMVGNVIGDPTGNFDRIRYVRTRIVNFTHELIVPFIMRTMLIQGFRTTLPRESLGIPREGAVQPC